LIGRLFEASQSIIHVAFASGPTQRILATTRMGI